MYPDLVNERQICKATVFNSVNICISSRNGVLFSLNEISKVQYHLNFTQHVYLESENKKTVKIFGVLMYL